MTDQQKEAMIAAAKAMVWRATDLESEAYNLEISARYQPELTVHNAKKVAERKRLDAQLFKLCAGTVGRLIEKDQYVTKLEAQLLDMMDLAAEWMRDHAIETHGDESGFVDARQWTDWIGPHNLEGAGER